MMSSSMQAMSGWTKTKNRPVLQNYFILQALKNSRVRYNKLCIDKGGDSIEK